MWLGALELRGTPGSLNSYADKSSAVPCGGVRQSALILDGGQCTNHCSKKQALAAHRFVLPHFYAKGQISS